jgi:hypothetical protein
VLDQQMRQHGARHLLRRKRTHRHAGTDGSIDNRSLIIQAIKSLGHVEFRNKL